MSDRDARHKGFISEFVGELYAILIGLGIASVILNVELSLANLFQIILALFVTVIVSLYWWDWAAYVKKQFVATPTEFAIDFAVLIVLGFLFLHYKQPVRLAATFLALGVVDLCWVVNHIRQSPDQSFVLRKWWLGQKFLGLIIYGTGLSLVLWTQDKGGLVLSGTCVILTAILVRIFCFGEVRRKLPLTFRPVFKDDFADMLSINKTYIDSSRGDSFLLEELSETLLYTLAKERRPRLFVAVKEREIIACAKVDWSIDESILSSLIWLDPQLKSGIRNGRILHIEQVAVDPTHAGKGIGKHFYNWIIAQHSSLLPCAFVALRPRCNATSLRFHAALGFEKAALFRSDSFLGQLNYQSLLYVFSADLPENGMSDRVMQRNHSNKTIKSPSK